MGARASDGARYTAPDKRPTSCTSRPATGATPAATTANVPASKRGQWSTTTSPAPGSKPITPNAPTNPATTVPDYTAGQRTANRPGSAGQNGPTTTTAAATTA